MEVSLAAADVLEITAVAVELPPSTWCGTLKRLGTRPRWPRQPSAPDAGVQLEEYDSRLPGTDRPARTPPAPTQGCHRREAPARGPRCSVSRSGPGSRQLGEPARTHDRRSFPTRTPVARAGSVGKPARRRQVNLLSWTRTEYRPPGLPRCDPSCLQPDAATSCLWKHRSFPIPTPRAPTRTGPAIPDVPLQPPRTRGLAPGTDPRTLGPMRRPAMTDPSVPPFDPPGPIRGPRTSTGSTTRVSRPAYNAQPGRT